MPPVFRQQIRCLWLSHALPLLRDAARCRAIDAAIFAVDTIFRLLRHFHYCRFSALPLLLITPLLSRPYFD